MSHLNCCPWLFLELLANFLSLWQQHKKKRHDCHWGWKTHPILITWQEFQSILILPKQKVSPLERFTFTFFLQEEKQMAKSLTKVLFVSQWTRKSSALKLQNDLTFQSANFDLILYVVHYQHLTCNPHAELPWSFWRNFWIFL